MAKNPDRTTLIKSLNFEISELERRLEVLRAAIQVIGLIDNETLGEAPVFTTNRTTLVEPTKSERNVFDLLAPLFEEPRAYTVSEMYNFLCEHPEMKDRNNKVSDSLFRYYIQRLYKTGFLFRYAAEGQPNERKYWYSTRKHFLENGYPNIELKRHISNSLNEYFKKSLLNEGGR
ncbi:MAG: hypothetical protein RL204_624 [Bacteroidota bacterium]|jgi:hypothetical protein